MYSMSRRPDKCLILSSCLFTVPTVIAYQYNNYITSYLALFIFLTSLNYHYSHTRIAYWIDQLAIYSVIGRSAVDGYNGGFPGTFITITINTYNYIVFFSPLADRCVFNKNTDIGSLWHASIHLFAVLGIILQQVVL